MTARGRRRRGALLCSLCLPAGCESHAVTADAGPSEPSPNASILPAPLATGPETLHAVSDAGPSDASADAEALPPSSAREDEAWPADTEELHDAAGVTARARFRWTDVVLPGRMPETNGEALERTRAASTFDLELTLAAAGRLCLVLAAPRFVLAQGSEFRARVDRYGQLLSWPDQSRYVVVQPGALRTVLNERRADTVPLSHASGTARGMSQALGYAAERLHFATPLGKLELEQAHVAAAGAGAALLCRFLVELAGVHPDSPSCRAEYLPVRAEYAWLEGGAIAFEVNGLERSSSLEVGTLRAPPEGSGHRIGELPAPPAALLLERAQLRALRVRPAPVRPAKDAPKEGLLLVNGDDLLRYALVDGLPAARLEPHGAGLLLDLVAGTYSVASRTFLGDEVMAPVAATVPGRLVTAEAPRQDLTGGETAEGAPGTRTPRPGSTPPHKGD